MTRLMCLSLVVLGLAAAPGCSSCFGGNSCRRPSFMEFGSPCGRSHDGCGGMAVPAYAPAYAPAHGPACAPACGPVCSDPCGSAVAQPPCCGGGEAMMSAPAMPLGTPLSAPAIETVPVPAAKPAGTFS